MKHNEKIQYLISECGSQDINAIDQFYDASLVGNLRLDLRPVERALWGCDE